MKRMLAMLLVILMLSGCGGKEAAPEKTEETAPTPAEQVQPKPESAPEKEAAPVPKPVPAPAPEPEPAPEIEPEPEPVEPEAIPEPAPEPETDWAAFAKAAYTEIVSQEEFRVLVWQEDDTRTDLIIQKGVNDWNVEGSQHCLDSFQWTPAASEDWIAMVHTEGYDPQLSFYIPGGVSFTCCEEGDIVEIVDRGEITYLRAVNPNLDLFSYERNLYGTLIVAAEDAVSRQNRYVTADGSLSPEEAAWAMAERIAENCRNMPNWMRGKPTDARTETAEVFDLYHGEPQEFCFILRTQLYFDEAAASNTMYWQAGAGLEGLDEEGWYRDFSEVHVRKNEDGDWAIVGRGTGGYSVNPLNTENKPQLDWLVETFCLTEGFSHEWRIPYHILDLSEEELAALPAILDQLTEQEARELCTVLGNHLRVYNYWAHTVESLRLILGDYGDWLDA